MIIWPGIERYNYAFQTPYKESWARFIDGVGESSDAPGRPSRPWVTERLRLTGEIVCRLFRSRRGPVCSTVLPVRCVGRERPQILLNRAPGPGAGGTLYGGRREPRTEMRVPRRFL
jgi:hypothetical protein